MTLIPDVIRKDILEINSFIFGLRSVFRIDRIGRHDFSPAVIPATAGIQAGLTARFVPRRITTYLQQVAFTC